MKFPFCNGAIKVSEALSCRTSDVFLDFIYNYAQATHTRSTMPLSSVDCDYG